MSVRKRGEKWVATIEAGRGPDGKRRRVQETFDRKKDAQLFEARQRQQSAAGLSVVPEKMTLAQYLDRWLAAVGPTLAPATVRRYENIAHHVSGRIGYTPLARLKAVQVEAMYGELRAEGKLSPQSIKHIHRGLYTALEKAVTWRLIPFNPMAGIKAPKVPRTEMRALDEDESRRLLQAALEDGTPAAIAVVIALRTGLRLGEICGLRWKDIDFEREQLAVTSTLNYLSGRGMYRQEPKTKGSRRTVSFDGAVRSVLEAQRRQQRIDRVRWGPDYADGDCVLATALGTPMDPGNIRRTFHRLLTEAGIEGKVRFHDLRHTHATLLIMNGIPARLVAERLGHANMAFTLDTYGHVLPGEHEKAVKVLDALLGG